MATIYQFLKGNLISPWFYRLSQAIEKRDVSSKLKLFSTECQWPFSERKEMNKQALIDMLEYAGKHVPYYRDLYKEIEFDPQQIKKDFKYFYNLPYLTKDIVREQGERLLADGWQYKKQHPMKTGGSTGKSVIIYYGQEDADWSSAVTIYSRASIGKKHSLFEMHFASRFPEKFSTKARLKEFAKTFAMNRYNVFFDALNEKSLEAIWKQIKKKKPYLLHAHPSTIYALALYVGKKYGPSKAFTVFESSGELLDKNKRKVIAENLQCQVVDRYGLAEFGVVAYQTSKESIEMEVYDTLVFPEMRKLNGEAQTPEIVLTGLKNAMMPLIRYRTGDRGQLEERDDGYKLKDMTGRIHDLISIGGVDYPTHYIQDLLDRIGGVEEFQLVLQTDAPILLKLVLEPRANAEDIKQRVTVWWKGDVDIEVVSNEDLIRVGWREKFRYVVEQHHQ